MTVLVAGAGIAGLTLALSLERIGVPVQVFEAVREIRPLGVGINLQPHAVRELDELGLLERLDAIGLRTREVAYFSSHGETIWSEPRGVEAGYDWPQFSVHRGALQMMLLEAVRERLGPAAVRTGFAVGGWRQTADGVEVELSERATGAALGTARGAVFIAADGIHSAARAALYPEEGPPVWGGIVMWRGMTRGPRFLTGRSMAMAGCKARKFVCYPIADIALDDGTPGSLINWIADLSMPPEHLWRREDWNRAGNRDDFLPRFADWHFDWLDVPQVIERAEAIFEYPMVDRDPLPRWTHGPMTLLGDAAHPMYPIGSNGASQAILDARVLTREILRHGANEIALIDYEAERRPATERIVRANRADGPDAVLDVVEARAPQGFRHIHEVLSRGELEEIAAGYKSLAGFDVAGLNARAPIVPPGQLRRAVMGREARDREAAAGDPAADPAAAHEPAFAFDPGLLNDLAGHLMRHAFLRAQQVFSEVFEGEGLTSLQFMALELIDRNPGIGHRDVARALSSVPSVMTTALRPLIEGGLVERAPVAGDGRKVGYRLSAPGETRYRALRPRIRLAEDRLLAALSEEEACGLRDALRRITGRARAVGPAR